MYASAHNPTLTQSPTNFAAVFRSPSNHSHTRHAAGAANDVCFVNTATTNSSADIHHHRRRTISAVIPPSDSARANMSTRKFAIQPDTIEKQSNNAPNATAAGPDLTSRHTITPIRTHDTTAQPIIISLGSVSCTPP